MSAGLNIVFLSPGTGGWYCGACMRDNALTKSLHAAGHRVSLLPMYLPLHLDEAILESSGTTPVFFGGINVFLRRKSKLFRHTPRWLDKLLDHPALLRRVARHSHMTSPRDHGEITLAMLRLEQGFFARELNQLCDWLEHEKTDILCLSTALQAGMIRELKRRLGVEIVCFFQGEDGFIDGLPDPWRDACWREMALRLREADVLISPSRFYADLMRKRLAIDGLEIAVLPNGIDREGYETAISKQGPPVIGYLARMCREKGLEIMVEAFVRLRTELAHPDARLVLAGTATAENEPLIQSLKHRLEQAGLTDQVSWRCNLSRAEKAAMLGSLTLFSVPAIHQEAFGLYVIEAMACGVPVVQPDSASFPEIIGQSGAGMLTAPGDPAALARAWHALLSRPEEIRRMAENARNAAERLHDIGVMCDRFVEILTGIHVSSH